MKTSLNDIAQIEKYLADSLPAQEKILFESRLLADKTLKTSVLLQQKMHTLLRYYHRASVKREMEQIHQRLFADADKQSFQQSIHQVFNS